MNSFMDLNEVCKMGFKDVGKDVSLSRKASFYSPELISVGTRVRIDDFCILSGKIVIGNNVHIAAGTFLYGGEDGIFIGDYSTISSRCGVYAVSDDYSGESMTNPCIPDCFKKIKQQKVVIHQHVIIGTGCTILPGVTIEEGVAVGSMSLINKNLEKWHVYAGIPCKEIKERKKDLLDLEKEYLKSITKS